MIRKDFILRLIEEIARAIAQMLHLLKDNDVLTAEQLYNSSFKMIKGVDEEVLLNTENADLYQQLGQEHGTVDDFYQSLSYLLYVGGCIAKEKGDALLAQKKWQKALDMLQYLDVTSTTYSFDRIGLIEKVKTALSNE